MDKKTIGLILLTVLVLLEAVDLTGTFDRPDYSPEKTEVVLRPNLIYSSGNVLVFDDFESPTLKGWVAGTVGYAATLSTAKAFTGSGSMSLTAGTTSPYYSGIHKYYGMPPSQKQGVQFVWNSSTTALKYVYIHTEGMTITNWYIAKVRYDYVEGKWEYATGAATWADIPGAAQAQAVTAHDWHFIKLVVDYSTGKFIRLYSDADSWDMSSLSMYDAGVTVSKRLSLVIRNYSQDNTQPVMYIDDLAITEE